jgi:hypothetical protein
MPADFRDSVEKSSQELQSLNVLQQKMSSMDRDALLAAAKHAAEERRLMNLLQSLHERVAQLESTVRKLNLCTVQQFADGRLHLPAGSRLKLAFLHPNQSEFVYHTVDLTHTWVEGPRPFEAQGRSPASSVFLVGTSEGRAPPLPTGPAPNTGSSLGQSAGSAGNWQSTAASNGSDNPLGGRRMGF